MNNGAIYLGTEQFITLVTVLSICGGILVFLLKHSFNQINNGIAGNSTKIESIKNDLQQDIQKNHDKVNERINKLEDKTNADITEIRQNLNDIKGDFATTFVLREDFFRYMNSMEENIKDTNRRKNNGTE